MIKPKSLKIARELYESLELDSPKDPKERPTHKPINLTLDTVKSIFNNIEELGARAFFLILAETGLRVWEVLNLRVDQIDFNKR